jgi:hypothetical protein
MLSPHPTDEPDDDTSTRRYTRRVKTSTTVSMATVTPYVTHTEVLNGNSYITDSLDSEGFRNKKAPLQQMERVRERSIAVLCNCPLWPCHLTLSQRMSYIYEAPRKARNFNILHIYIYIWTYIWQR